MRGQATLRLHRDIAKFVSPRLGIRFEMTEPEMTVYGPDGGRFLTFEEQRAGLGRDNAAAAAASTRLAN